MKSDIFTVFGFFFECSAKKNAILIGSSTGSFANFSLSYYGFSNILGIVAISPTWVYNPVLASNSLDPNKTKKDIFMLIQTLKQLNTPVFIIHGKKDAHSKYLNSIAISKKICNLFEWYPKKGEHLNIISKYRLKFYFSFLLLEINE